MPALLASSCIKALDILEGEPQRISKLKENITEFRKLIQVIIFFFSKK